MLYSDRLKNIEDELVPVGYFSAVEDTKPKYTVEGGEVWAQSYNTGLF
jgi:hypothetical protein